MHFKEAINFKLIVFLFEHKMSYFQQTDNKTYTKIYNNTEWNGKEQQQQQQTKIKQMYYVPL